MGSRCSVREGGRTDTDTTKIIHALRNFANAPKIKVVCAKQHTLQYQGWTRGWILLAKLESYRSIYSLLWCQWGSTVIETRHWTLYRKQLHPVPTLVRFPSSIIILRHVIEVRSLLEFLPTIIIHQFSPPTSLLHVTAPDWIILSRHEDTKNTGKWRRSSAYSLPWQ